MKYLVYSVFVISVMLSGFVYGQDKQYILALSKGQKKLIELDYNTLDSITVIPVGEASHEIAIDSEKGLAYISRPEMNNNGHAISIVNLRTLQRDRIFNTRPFYIPHGLKMIN